MSRTAVGWQRVSTHLGVTMTGSTSTRYRSISNDAEPEPMITAASQLGDRHRTVGKNPADLVAAGEVGGQVRAAFGRLATQPTQVHDATDPGRGRRVADVGRRLTVARLPLVGRADRVHQVVEGVDPRDRIGHVTGHVALDHLDGVTPGCGVELRRRAGQAPDAVAGLEQLAHQPPADVARRPGHEDQRPGPDGEIRARTRGRPSGRRRR